jgi:hypothetical protein
VIRPSVKAKTCSWRQGNLLAAILWLATIAVHLGYDQLVYSRSHLGEVTIFLYLAISFAIQRMILQARARRLPVALYRVTELIGSR